ncbi:cupin domain-containing protein [Flavimobilis sp. GY10621]|uniref:Cupin domain-containing protein n=1 Tax=Flavimobilis rhizosphaerae TaxID=2775421 RepID=A0ABR9DNA7_9MICO|nr:cupin domain-containing protein [Flavimobilis rhizosphaerae]MBD9698603.1 cupin domain-containing protein [Flavimobilis rhizosphaerae]
MEKHSLVALARELLVDARVASAGRAARTVVGGHERVLRQTVVALRAGATLADHDNPGEATVHVLVGRLVLRSGDVAWEGTEGSLLEVPQARHAVEALEDTAFVLTVAKAP